MRDGAARILPRGPQGAGFFEKLNPYLIVRLSPQKRFQTRNMMNGGKDPYFNHTGILVYDGEPGLESAMPEGGTAGDAPMGC